MSNLKMARFLSDLCLLSEVEYDNTNKLDFEMHTSSQYNLNEIILENHLPRLIVFKFPICATSFGIVDVSALPPVKLEENKTDILVNI